jgi:hypothetical protein
VPLFLDRLPLHVWTPETVLGARPRWSVSLPVVPTEAGLETPPARVRPQRWVLDTAFSGEALSWRHHLEEAGLNPDESLSGPVPFAGALGGGEDLPIREADVWLFSNVPGLRDRPLRLELSEGIAFPNVARLPDRRAPRPLIGMRALRRAGLRVVIDFATDTVSVWTPGPWYRNVFSVVRRTLWPRSAIPVRWEDDPS